MKNIVLGIGGSLGHDSNAALMVEGELIAASQEERFSRFKHDGCFPAAAIQDCLEIAGLKPSQVEVCVFTEKIVQRFLYERTRRPNSYLGRLISRILPVSLCPYPAAARQLLPNAEFFYGWHHHAHIAATFHTSNFDSAAFLCLDGVGENASASIGRIDHDKLNILYEQPYENGLGMFYFLVTMFLGFETWGSEYKVMGLASYGTPKYIKHLRSMLVEGNSGGVRLRNNKVFFDDYESILQGRELVATATGIPVRQHEAQITSEHADIAASLQAIFEEEVLTMAKFVRQNVDEDNLIFCGGCAQNCVVAGRLRDSLLFSKVFVSPVGGDMGNAMGATLLYERQNKSKKVKIETSGYYLGSAPGKLPEEAKQYRLDYQGSLHQFVARLLAEGQTIGLARGRMELGARALGARSILADPRQSDMQSVLNQKIKFRESFRPFAPSVLAEEAGKWFNIFAPSDYMQYTASLKEEHRYPQPEKFNSLRDRLDFVKCVVPSIVHVDYSARLQTVDANIHPDFYQLIRAFFDITGIPMVINTSFNIKGQPIVRTAVEAWECFINTDLDILVVDDLVLKNPSIKSEEEKIKWAKEISDYSIY